SKGAAVLVSVQWLPNSIRRLVAHITRPADSNSVPVTNEKAVGGQGFLDALTRELAADLDNRFGADNWEHTVFGPYPGATRPTAEITLEEVLSRIESAVAGLQETYDLLAD